MREYALPPAKIPEALTVLEKITPQADEKSVQQAFRKACERLEQRHEERRNRGGGKSTENVFLRRHVYLIGLKILEAKKVEFLRSLFPDESRRRKGLPSLEENIFFWILTHIFGRDDTRITLAARNRMAYQLIYASRHGIPPYLLSGFLHQVGNPDGIGKKVKDLNYESWHPCSRKEPGGEEL